MATKSFRTLVSDNAYTLVGSGVTAFAATENKVGQIRVVVVDVGDPAPLVTETQYIPFDDLYSRNLDVADIYMMSPAGDAWISGEPQ